MNRSRDTLAFPSSAECKRTTSAKARVRRQRRRNTMKAAVPVQWTGTGVIMSRARPLTVSTRKPLGQSSKPRSRLGLLMGPPLITRFKTRRSEEHTSELQSHSDLVCRLLLEKKKKKKQIK